RRPDRLEGRGDIETPMAESGVDAGRAEVVGGEEKDLDDLRAGQVGECLSEKRRGAADRRCREASPVPQILSAAVVGRAVAVSQRSEIIARAGPGLVGEIRKLADVRAAAGADTDR